MAEGEDEILFSGEYKGFRLGIHFNLDNRSESDAAYALALISEKIEKQAFQFSGISLENVEKIAAINGTGLRAVVEFLQKNKPNELRSALIAAAGKDTLLPAAESYFFSVLLEKAGVPYKIKSSMLPPGPKAAEEKPEDVIALVGHCKNWVAIKKLSVNPKTEDWEVSAILSGINNTIINKAFDFALGGKESSLDSKVPSGGKKAYGNIAAALLSLQLGDNQIENAYLVRKAFEAFGYKPFANPEMLSAEHPEVKGVKVRGRKPKG